MSLVHQVRLFRPSPVTVQCLALSPQVIGTDSLLALARENDDIEIWNIGKVPFLQKWIPGSAESSVEALAWVDQRLFSTGVHGLVVEHDLHTLASKSQLATSAGPAWCMKYSKRCNRLAVGTERGVICLLEVTAQGLVHDKWLDRQEGRILSLDWHKSGDFIVTGSPDSLRVWNVASGHPVSRMTTGRSEKAKETNVWSVAFINGDDFTIISGDSRGKTCFWDGKQGTLLDAYQTHKAGVLAVSVNPNKNVAYSSGIDPFLTHFQPISLHVAGKSKWVKSIHRQVHTHDVRDIVCDRSRILSGGVDSSLVVNDIIRRVVTKYPSIPFGKCVEVAKEAGILVFRYRKHLQLWKLAVPRQDPGDLNTHVGSILPLSDEPLKLVEICTGDDEAIRTFGVSPDASLIAYATPTRNRVFRLTLHPSEMPVISKLESKAIGNLSASHHIALPLASRLVSATSGGDLEILTVNESSRDHDSDVLEQLSRLALGLKTSISHLACQKDMAIVAGFDGIVVAVDTSKCQVLAAMPLYQQAPITCLSLDEESLWIVYADQRVVECCCKTGRFTARSQNLDLGTSWQSRQYVTRGVVVSRSRNYENRKGIMDKVFLYDDTSISSLKCNTETSQNGPCPKQSKPSKAKHKGKQTRLSSCNKYKYLIHFDSLSDNSFIAVEVTPEMMESQLPPSLKQDKFGTA